MNQQLTPRDLNRKAFISGMFFVIVQLLVRGLTFLTTPLYTRLVSTAQFGELRVYESWLLILVPILSLTMYKSVNRAKFDFDKEYEAYISSVQGLSYIVTAGCFILITLFFRKPFMDFCRLDLLMYITMFLYIFADVSLLYYQGRERQMLRYKRSVIVTACVMVPATVLSIVLLYIGNKNGMQNELVDLRVIGYYWPQIIGGLIVAGILFFQGRFTIRVSHWKYALLFSLPLIPEALSIQIMNQSDKIMIQKMIGDDYTGIFSLATTVSFIIWIILDAVWSAWLPWLYEKLDRNEIEDIRKPWEQIVFFFAFFSWVLVVLAPEIIALLGGARYKEAIYLVAPMVSGVLFRFFSYSFTAVENYRKKTKYTGLGTVIAMILNVILNAVFIYYFGYQAAAYTTAFSYLILMLLQGFFEMKICGMRCISLKWMFLVSLLIWLVNEASMLLHKSTPIRWGVFLAAFSLAAWKLFPMAKDFLGKIRKTG